MYFHHMVERELGCTQMRGCWCQEAEHLKMANALNTQAPEDACENISGVFVFTLGVCSHPRCLILVLHSQLFNKNNLIFIINCTWD